jgi:hypothetical protein
MQSAPEKIIGLTKAPDAMGNQSHHHFGWLFFVFILFMATMQAFGQGGPPMITDDPFTPENGHWENNFAFQFIKTTSSKEFDVPAADINYGYGNRIQLKVQLPMLEELQYGGGSKFGVGDLLIGVKARFLDEEQCGIAVSTYPQYEFNNFPEEGGAPQFFLPLEAAKSFGRFHVAADGGYIFIASSNDEIAYGTVIGYDESEDCQLLAEAHADNVVHVGFDELILNLGVTYKLSSSFIALGSAGTTLYSREPGRTYLAFIGVQWLI